MNRLEVDMIDLHQVPEDLVHQDWEYQGQGERAHLGNFFFREIKFKLYKYINIL